MSGFWSKDEDPLKRAVLSALIQGIPEAGHDAARERLTVVYNDVSPSLVFAESHQIERVVREAYYQAILNDVREKCEVYKKHLVDEFSQHRKKHPQLNNSIQFEPESKIGAKRQAVFKAEQDKKNREASEKNKNDSQRIIQHIADLKAKEKEAQDQLNDLEQVGITFKKSFDQLQQQVQEHQKKYVELAASYKAYETEYPAIEAAYAAEIETHEKNLQQLQQQIAPDRLQDISLSQESLIKKKGAITKNQEILRGEQATLREKLETTERTINTAETFYQTMAQAESQSQETNRTAFSGLQEQEQKLLNQQQLLKQTEQAKQAYQDKLELCLQVSNQMAFQLKRLEPQESYDKIVAEIIAEIKELSIVERDLRDLAVKQTALNQERQQTAQNKPPLEAESHETSRWTASALVEQVKNVTTSSLGQLKNVTTQAAESLAQVKLKHDIEKLEEHKQKILKLQEQFPALEFAWMEYQVAKIQSDPVNQDTIEAELVKLQEVMGSFDGDQKLATDQYFSNTTLYVNNKKTLQAKKGQLAGTQLENDKTYDKNADELAHIEKVLAYQTASATLTTQRCIKVEFIAVGERLATDRDNVLREQEAIQAQLAQAYINIDLVEKAQEEVNGKIENFNSEIKLKESEKKINQNSRSHLDQWLRDDSANVTLLKIQLIRLETDNQDSVSLQERYEQVNNLLAALDNKAKSINEKVNAFQEASLTIIPTIKQGDNTDQRFVQAIAAIAAVSCLLVIGFIVLPIYYMYCQKNNLPFLASHEKYMHNKLLDAQIQLCPLPEINSAPSLTG